LTHLSLSEAIHSNTSSSIAALSANFCNQDQTWACLPMNEFMEISWHRPDVMRYQDASFLGGDFKDCEIIFPSRSRFESLQETYSSV
jgi:hypothetical protein